MHKTVAETSRGTLSKRTGTEGPAHDPYGWTEWTWSRPGRADVTLREGGLSGWLRRGQRVLVSERSACRDDGRRAHALFVRELGGYEPDQLEEWGMRARARCPKCRGRDLREHAGYPGETFTVCHDCGEIVDCDFNEAAIM